MTTTAANMRKERIERLLSELEYEVTRGVMEREIQPDLHLTKTFPCLIVDSDFAVLEVHVYPLMDGHRIPQRPNLRLVQNGGVPAPPASEGA